MPAFSTIPKEAPATSPAMVELDRDMTTADLVELLPSIRFPGGASFQPLRIDREVRDFLVRVLRTR